VPEVNNGRKGERVGEGRRSVTRSDGPGKRAIGHGYSWRGLQHNLKRHPCRHLRITGQGNEQREFQRTENLCASPFTLCEDAPAWDKHGSLRPDCAALWRTLPIIASAAGPLLRLQSSCRPDVTRPFPDAAFAVCPSPSSACLSPSSAPGGEQTREPLPPLSGAASGESKARRRLRRPTTPSVPFTSSSNQSRQSGALVVLYV
jgi:hypothetical protein